MRDRFLSSAGAGGNCARPMRLLDPSPLLDTNCPPIGPETLSSTEAGVWRKAPMAFPDSSSVLDKLQSAKEGRKEVQEKSILTGNIFQLLHTRTDVRHHACSRAIQVANVRLC